MKIALICFAREDSTRFPKKNMALLHGKPLVQYTIDSMLSIALKTGMQCYMLTDFDKVKMLTIQKDIKVIWRDHPKDWDDIRLNRWAHEKIKADAYVLLQPTSPYRNVEKIIEWILTCIHTGVKSAFSIYATDRKNYVMNGSFFYYTKDMLKNEDIIDDKSLVFLDEFNVDIDTREDLMRAES